MKNMIPPHLFLFCLIAMVGIRNLFVIKIIIPEPLNYSGLVLMITGIMMTIKVRKEFEQVETEIHTFKNPGKLVTNGLFRISRNPIYLGFTISLIGVWILLGTILPMMGCVLFILIANYYYIPFEEKIMENTFGDEYQAYKSKVRRWI